MPDHFSQPDDAVLPPFTRRENEILALLAARLSDGEIAARLSVGLSTVKWYVRQISEKLGAHNRREAVQRALELGWVDPDRVRSPAEARAAARGFRSSLPTQMTTLVGRESEIAEVLALLHRPACRLLTLTGPGGIGKTRLAVQAAAQMAAQPGHPFPDGIFFLALQPAGDPATAAQAAFVAQPIIDAIGLPAFGAEEPQERLIHYLRERAMLLVLDNFEHVLQSAPENAFAARRFVEELVKAAPGVKLLVTSRTVVNLSSEWIYPVEGLAYPRTWLGEAQEALPTLEDSLGFPAVRLFSERARQVRPGFSPAAELAGIIAICQAVAGLPLALEMAAAWTKLLSCAAIAAEIQRSLAFLEARYQDMPARHRSALAVINQSWEALGPEEREVFARLAVFSGGFDRPAAEQVAGASLPVLSALVDQSLLSWGPDGRYQVHELLRQFAQDRLYVDSEAARRTRQQHCRYFADFMRRRSVAITGPRQPEILREITAELQNVLAAWRQALSDADLAALLDLAYPYYLFCDFTGRYLQGAEAFERAIARVAELVEPGPPAGELLALLHALLGYHYIRLGKYAPALETFQASQAILAAHGLEVRPGFGSDPTIGLGLLALVNGDYPASLRYARAGRAASLERDDPLNLQIACYVLASAAFSVGEHQLALADVQQGLASAEVTGNRWMKAHLLGVQGEIAQAQQQYGLARQKFQQCYQIKQELNDPEGEANALNHLAIIARRQNNFLAAYELYEMSLEIYQHINDPGGLGGTNLGMGDAALAQGDFPAACRCYQQGLQIAADIGWLPLAISLLAATGDLLLQAGREQAGAALLKAVLAHPAGTQEARLRARHCLEAALGQAGVEDFSEHAPPDEEIWRTCQDLLVELTALAEEV